MLVADAQKLEDKNEYNWAVKVIIPTAMEESFESDKEIHKWQFLAELNAFGTNPSSEWITVDMNKDKEALSA